MSERTMNQAMVDAFREATQSSGFLDVLIMAPKNRPCLGCGGPAACIQEWDSPDGVTHRASFCESCLERLEYARRFLRVGGITKAAAQLERVAG